MFLADFLDRHFGASFMARRSEGDRDEASDLRASQEIPFGENAYYNDHTLRSLDDALIQFVKLEGLYADKLDDVTVDVYKHQRNTALETIADSHVGIYVYDIRRQSRRWPGGTYRQWFPNYLNQRLRQRRQKKPLYQHEIYLAVVRYRHHRGTNGWIDRLFARFSLGGGGDRLESVERQARDLEERVDSVMKSLAHYAPRRLGRVEEACGTCCEMARFLRYLITLEDGPILADAYHLGQALATAYLSFGRNKTLGQDVFEVRGVNHWRIGQVMGMSRWPGGSVAGMAESFVKLPVELIVTQKFFPIDKLDASMQAATAERRAGHDATLAPQAGEVADLRQRQAANRSIQGHHHMSVLLHVPVNGDPDEAIARLDTAAVRVGDCFKSWGVPPVIESTGMERAVWSQVPGAKKRHNGRIGKIETIDFAAFASMHGFPKGRFDGNLWGECLMILPTEAGTEYCLNFHKEIPGMVAGHVNIGALTGLGKTLLMSVCLSQADKFEPRVVWFDRENGATVFMQAMEAVDIELSLSRSLGNPCKMPNTEANRALLRELLQMMATCYGDFTLQSDDIERIAKAVSDNFDDSKTSFADRRLRNLAWHFGRGTPLEQAMAVWHSGGANAAVFDNDDDPIDFSQRRHYRIEMRHLMRDKDPRPELAILLNYLTHRAEQALDGNPAIIVWDEAQVLIRNPFWQNKIATYRETFRRRNCVTVFITPEPRALYTPVLAVRNQAATSIYLANDTAQEVDYIGNLDCSASEFQYIKRISPIEYKMLIKKGAGVSVRASFDLSDMPDLIAVLSSNDKSVALMNEIRAELGTTDPARWVPVFMERALANQTHNLRGNA